MVANNIRNGISIFGITGNFRGWVDATYDAIAGGLLNVIYACPGNNGATHGSIYRHNLLFIMPAPITSCTEDQTLADLPSRAGLDMPESSYPGIYACCRQFNKVTLSVTIWCTKNVTSSRNFYLYYSRAAWGDYNKFGWVGKTDITSGISTPSGGGTYTRTMSYSTNNDITFYNRVMMYRESTGSDALHRIENVSMIFSNE